jgi:molecular chaperone Hsp33
MFRMWPLSSMDRAVRRCDRSSPRLAQRSRPAHIPAVSQKTFPLDDLAAPFQIDHEPVRGRLVRLGPAVDEILTRHAYPAPVANLLGETCALAALVGSSLKFEGRLIVQAQGKGPVSYVVADYDTEGALRGYCRYDEARLAELEQSATQALGARALLGEGVFIMTIDQGADMERCSRATRPRCRSRRPRTRPAPCPAPARSAGPRT